ncbi:MAG: type I DNA topoisomerase [Candidatus Moranbacteria bacterium CG_4_9_14_3_um_filter_42_9]|nr:MAG: type I DNA topoisomerase [Candidatus Moranbacteria bacterium CG_4_9_14_3_um_filter_42_9]
MKLVIVESPTKAKTISKFLGRTYTVKSSYGHIRDLPKKEMGIDIEHDFEPKYIIPAAAEKRVAELKKLAQKADKIILATDEDREGEAISWHLAQALGLVISKSQFPISKQNSKFKIQNSKFSRIVFHEITKKAIEHALDNPRKIDLNLVDAQQARRVLDRLVGYELSPFLWKKIRRGLSAGRVQSVALRLIVEREREIKNFKPEEYWSIGALLKNSASSAQEFEARLIKEKEKSLGKMGIKNNGQAEKIVKFLEKADYQTLSVVKKELQKTPGPAYTTSTLQQDANNKLGFSSKQTMVIAQQLYEGVNIGPGGPTGLITYMRTDSVNLSMESMLSARKVIEEKFGSKYALANPRFFKTKSKGAQEAHEAIRPAYPEKDPESLKDYLEPNQYRLYKLIWQRMIASQMSIAVLNSVTVDIEAKQKSSSDFYTLRANGSSIKFAGYLKVYGDKIPVTENILPELEENEILELLKVLSAQKFTQPPARYSEAALVKVLEEFGIGRPSTYAPTISTVIERKYVAKDDNKKLFPEEIGLLVSDLLVEHFSEIVDYKFTAKMEEDLDEIAEGRKKWVPVIRDFYGPFHKNLKEKTKEVKKEDFVEKIGRACPDCGAELIMKFGRFGKFIACSNYPECRHTEKTEAEKKVDEENKGEICEICGAPMVVKRGKFGTFLGCSNYPECKGIKRLEKKVGVKCPKCAVGEIVEKKSKRGRLFYGCSAYPKCDFALWSKPTSEKCPTCGSLLVFAAKGKAKCSNKECKFEK